MRRGPVVKEDAAGVVAVGIEAKVEEGEAALRRVLGEDKNYIEAHLLPEEEQAAEESQTDE